MSEQDVSNIERIVDIIEKTNDKDIQKILKQLLASICHAPFLIKPGQYYEVEK